MVSSEPKTAVFPGRDKEFEGTLQIVKLSA